MSKVAYIFPGQGSQALGMLSELAEEYHQIKDTFSQASEALGYDLWRVTQEGPEDRLNQTEVTQPALLTASYGIWQVLQDLGAPAPAFMAGHSLGEYSALVCAGALELSDAVKLVQSRGQYMQSAVPAGTGAMYAIIGLEDEVIQTICADTAAAVSQVVSPVNYNSPGQVVIAGTKEAAELAANACKEAGAKRALPLAVSVPSHCALMQPAADKLKQDLCELSINAPKVGVVNNVDVMSQDNADNISDALVRQLYSPVRWTESMQFMIDRGVDTFYEVGPGKVLTGLTKRINKTVTCGALNTPSAIQGL